MFVGSAARGTTNSGSGPTRGPGPAHSGTAFVNARDVTAAFTGRHAVHAEHDHASCPGSGDDCTHRHAFAKQRTPHTRRAHQQVAVRRNKVYETMARSER